MMAFDWVDYLRVAKDLAEKNDEASLRAAISRAYYAAFWTARILVEEDIGEIREARGVHEVVWNRFNYDKCSHGSSILDVGNLLKAQRIVADYRADKFIGRQAVQLAIRRAEALIADIKAL
jgi:uncharacterized protein (UPF0332 family)